MNVSRKNNARKKNLAFLWLGIAILALAGGCASPEPAVQETEPPPLPAATQTAALPAPSPTPTTGVEREMPPKDGGERSGTALAIEHLAASLGVRPQEVELVSSSEWTEGPLPCEIALPEGRAEVLLGDEFQRVRVSFKGRTYDYLVFRSVGGVPMAFPCQPEP